MRIFVTASRERGLWGLRLGRYYATLASPKWPAVFSERYRRGVSVLPLGRGWRLRLRVDALALSKGSDV